jgi:hypothetical protein
MTQGTRDDPVYVKVGESLLTWVTLIFSLGALAVSVVTAWVTWSPMGEVRAIEPSAHAIIRKDTLGSPGVTATTEHLVLPVELENDRGTPVLIRRLELTVDELRGDGGTHEFHLVKDYPILSGQAFKNDYDFRNSLTLQPHSVSTQVLSFRSENGDFEFAPYTEYEVTLRFLQNQVPLPGFLQTSRTTQEVRPWSDEPRWRFCTYDTAKMIHTGGVQWNWWGRFHEAHNGSCQA